MRSRFVDDPGIVMCGRDDTVRVHGCLWCGEPDHAAPNCNGPKLPEEAVQMTLREFQKWDAKPKRDWWAARNIDRVTHNTRLRDGRMRLI